MPATESIARVIDATRRYRTGGGPVVAVDGVSADVTVGGLTVVAGPSGSGKSTLLALLACLDRPDGGQVELEGRPVHVLSGRSRRALRRRRIGIVLPMPADNLRDDLDASGNLAWAATVRAGRRPSAQELDDALVAVGLAGSGHKRVRQLSGGEQQRLAIACALIGDPALIVADEPTASLDRVSAASVVTAMRAAADRGVTLAVASHDAHVLETADQIVRLDHGRRIS